MDSSDDMDETKARKLCAACVGESYLKDKIESEGTNGDCDYCHKTGKTFSIGKLCEIVEVAFEQNYARTSEEEGDATVYAIMNAADIPEDAATDIQQVLEEEHAPAASDYVGEPAEFDEEVYYAEKSDDGEYWQEQWRTFERSLKTEARFFSRQAEDFLKRVFDGIDGMRTEDKRPLVIEAGPETEHTHVFRARAFENMDALQIALQRPDLHLGPPPALQSKDGRMNARGISVFYGARDPQTALAEVRPPVGCRVVTGRFKLLRRVRLLDLTALSDVTVRGSVFDPTFGPMFERVTFLKDLSAKITRPVMPTDESFAYLVTQAVADFLSSHSELSLDGIRFPSVQVGDGSYNFVLFQKAARVRQLKFPEGAELSILPIGYDESLPFSEFRVYEEIPKVVDKKPPDGFEFLHGFKGITWFDPEADHREETLDVELDSITVHSIKAVQFKTVDHKVERFTVEKREPHFGKPAGQTEIDLL